MARIIRGARKGESVEIHQCANDWATIDLGATVMKLGMLELTPDERIRHHDELHAGETFRRYDEDHFKLTGRFKTIQWARI